MHKLFGTIHLLNLIKVYAFSNEIHWLILRIVKSVSTTNEPRKMWQVWSNESVVLPVCCNLPWASAACEFSFSDMKIVIWELPMFNKWKIAMLLTWINFFSGQIGWRPKWRSLVMWHPHQWQGSLTLSKRWGMGAFLSCFLKPFQPVQNALLLLSCCNQIKESLFLTD